MKPCIALFVIVLLLLVAPTARAAPGNLMVNGSFEQGLVGWSVQSIGQVDTVGGLCDTNAANVTNAFMRQTGFTLKGGREYKLTFQYKGKVMVGTTSEILNAPDWTKHVRKFTADRTGDTVWVMGFQNSPGYVDCFTLKQVKSKP